MSAPKADAKSEPSCSFPGNANTVLPLLIPFILIRCADSNDVLSFGQVTQCVIQFTWRFRMYDQNWFPYLNHIANSNKYLDSSGPGGRCARELCNFGKASIVDDANNALVAGTHLVAVLGTRWREETTLCVTNSLELVDCSTIVDRRLRQRTAGTFLCLTSQLENLSSKQDGPSTKIFRCYGIAVQYLKDVDSFERRSDPSANGLSAISYRYFDAEAKLISNITE